MGESGLLITSGPNQLGSQRSSPEVLKCSRKQSTKRTLISPAPTKLSEPSRFATATATATVTPDGPLHSARSRDWEAAWIAALSSMTVSSILVSDELPWGPEKGPLKREPVGTLGYSRKESPPLLVSLTSSLRENV